MTEYEMGEHNHTADFNSIIYAGLSRGLKAQEPALKVWAILLHSGLAFSFFGYVAMIFNSTDAWRTKRENNCWCFSTFCMLSLLILLQFPFSIYAIPKDTRTTAAILFFACYLFLVSSSWSLAGAWSFCRSGAREDTKQMTAMSLLALLVPMPASLLVAFVPIVIGEIFAAVAIFFYLGQTIFTVLLASVVYFSAVVVQDRRKDSGGLNSSTVLCILYVTTLLIIVSLIVAIFGICANAYTGSSSLQIYNLLNNYVMGLTYFVLWVISYVVFLFTLLHTCIQCLF